MSPAETRSLLGAAWPAIVRECRAVLGGELHYQAVVYHCLRQAGAPAGQVGMNVKQWIAEPVTELFQARGRSGHRVNQGGFEPIPDIVLFDTAIGGNWQRRNFANTLRHMVAAIEVKASERANGRLSTREVARDIDKLCAHREEVAHLGGSMYPVMMVIDVAPHERERMLPDVLKQCADRATRSGLGWLYASPLTDQCVL